MKHSKFYICAHCGNLVEMVNDAGVKPFCCGQKMDELIPNTVEASGEKHIPAVAVSEDAVRVNVGTVDHPMVDVHYIEWVSLKTDKGSYRIHLAPGQEPNVTFRLGGEKPLAVYAYCNLHGLWVTELN